MKKKIILTANYFLYLIWLKITSKICFDFIDFSNYFTNIKMIKI